MPSRRSFLTALSASALTRALAGAAELGNAGAAVAEELCAVTYNLRYASPTGVNAWPIRRPVMKALLDELKPDVMGTQEGLYSQLREIAEDQPGLDWIGLGRDGGSRGEFMAIFYRRDRFEPLEYDHFWLSDTPLVMGSSTWGNTNRRMVTWTRFRDRRTGREFYFWNTHLDHQLQPAREKAAALILERIRTSAKAGVPLLLVGDFNAVSGENPVYDQLVSKGGLLDTWNLAVTRKRERLNSFNDFGPAVEQGKRIDWILSRYPVKVRETAVIDFKQDPQWPSDHCPVGAWLTLA
ncbi:MAG: endonuclease/exonuclease/phosphatase family protein [Verrucomicrobiota bacterium]